MQKAKEGAVPVFNLFSGLVSVVRGSKRLCGSNGICVCVCRTVGATHREEENLGRRRDSQELFFFFFLPLISEVARRGLSKVVKSICSGEGGKEKRLVARGKEHKGKIVHWERYSPWPWCSQTGLADRMIDCFVRGPRVRPELEALCLS